MTAKVPRMWTWTCTWTSMWTSIPAWFLVLFSLACSGKHAVDDHPPRRDATSLAAPPRDGAVGSKRAAGDVQIRVEWHDVPIGARASPGRTACDTPRAPAVAPTATWGIPEVVVIVDGAPARGETERVVVGRCAIAPRVAIAAPALAIASAEAQPVALALVRDRDVAHLATPARGTPIAIALPIAGHEVSAPLERGAIYELAGTGVEPAWIAADAAGAITDATGQVVVRDVPAGAHAITAWLPPRAGQAARSGQATVEIKPGALAEVTIELAP
jgi:hypothetical protein